MKPPPVPRNLPPGTSRYQPRVGAPVTGGDGLAREIRDAALRLGFCRVGFCGAEAFDEARRSLSRWLDAGHHGEMAYLEQPRRDDPGQLLDQARSLVVVALPHARDAPVRARADGAPIALTGRVARYARGDDYHEVLKVRLRRLAQICADRSGREVVARPCVDTAPLLEREAARRAGIGFTGKSTMSILPGFGTYALLGELLLDVELPPASPLPDQCGRCTACLDACPTRAFVDAHTLDARRCISYLTIELRGPIPRPLRSAIGNWVFGCDICQEVCPFNHSRRPQPVHPRMIPRATLSELDLIELLGIGASAHRRLVRGTAMRRASRRQLQRNAAVALGNSGSARAVAPLSAALRDNPSALVRAHAAWALGELDTPPARDALREALRTESDEGVLEELNAAVRGRP